MLRFRGRPREPPATPTGSKSLIFIGGLFKIEGRPFRVGVLTGVVLEAKMPPKWVSEFRYKKCYVSEDVPGSPQPPPQSQKGGFSLEGCLKSRVALFASGCLRDWFWGPKWLQNGRPNPLKSNQKRTSEIDPKIEPKSVPKWSRNDPKMSPK